MQNSRKAAIKEKLRHWRNEAIANDSFGTGGLDEASQQSRVLHDVFIDAIAENAGYIRCPQDLYSIAYYWKWVDLYGAEVYARVERYLNVTRRTSDDDLPRSKRTRR